MFFEPLPFITRVVFIDTPHAGSIDSERLPGRLARSLIRFPTELLSSYQELIAANSDLVSDSTSQRPTTSIENLSPTSPILLATQRLHESPNISLHSIVGTGHNMRGGDQGDGVVTTASASISCTQSERLVSAWHTQLQRNPETTDELRRILVRHLDATSSAHREMNRNPD